MKYRELLKEVLKSIKSGRLHTVIKLIFLIFIISFSAVSIYDTGKYLLQQKTQINIVKRNFKWGFNWKTKDVWFSVDYILIKNPNLLIELNELNAKLNLPDSIKSFSFVFDDLKFTNGEVQILNRKRKQKNRTFFSELPIKIRKVKVLKFSLLSKSAVLTLRNFNLSHKEFSLGGITGKLFNRNFQVLPTSGYYFQNRLIVPETQITFGNATILGNLEIQSLKYFKGKFNLESRYFTGKVSINTKNKKINLSWNGSLKGNKTTGQGIFLISKKAIKLLRVSGVFGDLRFSGKGKLTRTKIKIKGGIRGNFKYSNLLIGGLNSRFSLDGNFKKPKFKIWGTLKELHSEVLDVKNLTFKYEWSKELSRANFSSSQVSGTVILKPKEINGNLSFNNFALKSLKPLRKYLRYRKWIPKVVISGNLNFVKKGKTLDFKTNVSFPFFKFEKFKGKGNLYAIGSNNRVKFNLKIGNYKEKIKVNGTLNFKKLTLNSHLKFESIELSEFSFLKKIGLKGRVSGSGNLNGNLKNPQGRFDVYSKNLFLWNVSLGNVKGKIGLKNFLLTIKVNGLNVALSELKVFLKKPHSFFLKGKVNEISVHKVIQIVKGFRLKLPFESKGKISGTFQIGARNPKQKQTYSAFIKISDFYGNFKFEDFSSFVSCTGFVFILGSKQTVKLYGKLNQGKLKNQKIKEGKYFLKIKNRKMKLTLKDLKLHLPIDNTSEGKVIYDFKNKKLKARFRTLGFKEFSFGNLNLLLVSSIFGYVGNLTVNLNGKLDLNSKLLQKTINLKINGNLQEPQNFGIVTFSNSQTDVKAIFNGKRVQVVGTFKNISFNHKVAKVTINFGFINLNLTNLTGTIAIPTFKIRPNKFYPLYAVSGIYVSLEKGKLKVSGFSLSYLDGWIKLSEIKLGNFKSISGNLEGNLGVKGLVYLFKLNNIISYARNSLYVKGKFNYNGRLHYNLNIKSNQIEIKPKYFLNKAVVTYLNLFLKNGEIKKVKLILESGAGNVEVTNVNSAILITVSSLSIGELERWKGIISGNLKFSNNKLKGEINVSKSKLLIKKRERGRENKSSLLKLPINLNVDILFTDPVKLKGKLFWIDFIPKLKLKTENQRLIIFGTFLITNGEINYMGKKFKVIYGSGKIRNLQKLNGSLSLIANAHISGYYVYMKIQGKLQKPTIYLTSDPPLTRTQILNLVMTGASPEEIEASSEAFPAVQVAYYATSSFFKPVEEEFQKTLKLERFSIEPYITKYGETVAKLTLVKRLSTKIKLTGYGTTGQNPEYGGSVKYKVSGKYYLELRYNSYYGPEAGIGIEVNKK